MLVNWVFLLQGACEGNIRAPQTDLVNHMANDMDNRQQYQRYFKYTDKLMVSSFLAKFFSEMPFQL